MFPLQTIPDPAMAVVALSVVMILVAIFGFVWAYGKITTDADHGPDEADSRGV